MTPKSLFNIILKIFGLFFLWQIINGVMQLISAFMLFFQPVGYGDNGFNSDGFVAILIACIVLALYCFIVYLLVFRANYITEKLHLDKGFEAESFSMNLSTPDILSIALIVIGGVVLFNEIPNFCNNVFSFFQERSVRLGMTKTNYSYMILPAVKIILALLLIGERKRIVAFAERRREKTGEKEIGREAGDGLQKNDTILNN